MRKQTQKLIYCLIAGLLPIALSGFSSGPPIPRAGVPGDAGGQNCSACHRDQGPANSDPAGSVKIEAASYKPGIPQIIKVTVFHPVAQRWGLDTLTLPLFPSLSAAEQDYIIEAVRVKVYPLAAAT